MENRNYSISIKEFDKNANDNDQESLFLFSEIADALSEKDQISFTIHTKTNMPEYHETDFTVTRFHEDFVWLHDQFECSSDYAGIMIPPCPPKPIFDEPHEKLLLLTLNEGTLTNKEEEKLTAELKDEYLVVFKKTVAMHEVFLQRLTNHLILRGGYNLRCFLEYEADLALKTKSTRRKVSSFFHKFVAGSLLTLLAHDTAISKQDQREDLKSVRENLINYAIALRDIKGKLGNLGKCRRHVSRQYVLLQMRLPGLSNETDSENELEDFLRIFADGLEKLKKVELRLTADEDLKLTDTLCYYHDHTISALSLLNSRISALKNYLQASKEVEQLRTKNKPDDEAVKVQDATFAVYTMVDSRIKSELDIFEEQRVKYISRHLLEFAELNVRHNKFMLNTMNSMLQNMREL